MNYLLSYVPSPRKSLSELIRLLLLYLWSGKVRGRVMIVEGSPHVSTHLTINHIPLGAELKTCDNWSGPIIHIAKGRIYPSESKVKPTVFYPFVSVPHIIFCLMCLFKWFFIEESQVCKILFHLYFSAEWRLQDMHPFITAAPPHRRTWPLLSLNIYLVPVIVKTFLKTKMGQSWSLWQRQASGERASSFEMREEEENIQFDERGREGEREKRRDQTLLSLLMELWWYP